MPQYSEAPLYEVSPWEETPLRGAPTQGLLWPEVALLQPSSLDPSACKEPSSLLWITWTSPEALPYYYGYFQKSIACDSLPRSQLPKLNTLCLRAVDAAGTHSDASAGLIPGSPPEPTVPVQMLPLSDS